MIDIRNLTINSNQSGRGDVFRDFSLSVAGRDHALLIGPNGAGKSTLLDAIAGILTPSGGTISCDRRNLAYVPQNYTATLFPWFTTEWNIFSLCRYRRGNIASARAFLELLLEEFEVDFGLATRTNELSGGQQQLVCLMRALVAKPQILLLDEPCSALSDKRAE